MNLKKFSRYTENIKSQLHFWFQMKKEPNESVGSSFFSIFGMELDDIEQMLHYARKQYFIDTADINMQDIVYKASLPASIRVEDVLAVYSDKDSLSPVYTLYDFYLIEDRIKDISHNFNQNNVYFLDHINKTVFVREPYNKNEVYKDGAITINHKGQMIDIELKLHHIWNFFDEFGLIVGVKRLYGENNYKYKERILDVFKNPANSTIYGLANGIARELDLREVRSWNDMSEDFVIKDDMVLLDTIKINGHYASNTYKNTLGYVVIPGNQYLSSTKAEVTFIRNLSIFALNSHNEMESISDMLYLSDGTPTKKLLEYIELIRSNSSILWNHFNYDEATWVKDTDDYFDNHFAFVVNRLDAKIGGFAKYGFI